MKMSPLGELITRAMGTKGLSREQVVKLVGYHYLPKGLQMLDDLINGETLAYKHTPMVKLPEILEIPLEDFDAAIALTYRHRVEERKEYYARRHKIPNGAIFFADAMGFKYMEQLDWFPEAEDLTPRPLEESSLAQAWQKIEDEKGRFGIISGYRLPENEDDEQTTKKKNKERHGKLRTTIKHLGYGYCELIGGYKYEGDEDYTLERFFLVPNITKKELLDLCKRFEQKMVIYKDANEFVLLSQDCTIKANYVKDGGKDYLQLGKEAVKDYFSALLKGVHRGRKFAFKLLETKGIQNYIHAMGLNWRNPLMWYNIIEESFENEQFIVKGSLGQQEQ